MAQLAGICPARPSTRANRARVPSPSFSRCVIFLSLSKAMAILKNIDDKAISELQDQLLEAVPVDGA